MSSPLALAAALLTTAPALPPPPPAPPPLTAVASGALQGEWGPASGRHVRLDDKLSLDDAVTQIAQEAGWGLVLDTGSGGDEPVQVELRDVPVEQALAAVLAGSPFVAYREGSVISVARSGEASVAGLSGSGGKPVDVDDQSSLDDVLQSVGEQAGWNVVLHTGAAGDATVRVKLRRVPAELALRALVRGTPLQASRSGGVVAVTTGVPAPEAAPREVLEGFDPPTGKLFTGEFENTPADQAIRKLLDTAGLSVLLPHGSYRPVTAHFKDAAIEDALRAVCSEAGLSAVRRGTVVSVSRHGPTVGLNLHFPGITATLNDDDAQEAAEDARDAQRDAEEARREAAEEARDAAREAQDAAREAAEDANPGASGSDRVVTGDVTVAAGEHVRDLVAIHGKATLGPGARAREVTAVGGAVEIGPGAIVEHNATSIFGNVHVSPGAVIEHEAVSVGGRVIIDPSATVHGQPTTVALPNLAALPGLTSVRETHDSPLLALGWLVAKFGLYFALGLLLLLGWPRGVERVVHALDVTPARSTAIGLLGSVALPLLTALLIISVVGWVFLPVEGVLVALGTLLGFTALSVLVGRRLPVQRRLTSVGQLALGTGIITVLTNIPHLGTLLSVLGWVVVMGAVLSTRFGSQDRGNTPTFPIHDALDAQALPPR